MALTEVPMEQLPVLEFDPSSRRFLRAAIAHSLSYLATPSADKVYASPVAGITKDQVVRGLKQLDEVVATAADQEALNAAIKAKFRAFMSVGCDQRGTVLFTGYYTPIFAASTTPGGEYRYPLYRRPKDLVRAARPDDIAMQSLPDGSQRPYPARAEIESSGMLRGSELVWLTNPIEAYIIEVQGSARLRLPSGDLMEVGFDGTNGHPYHGIALDLVSEGKIPRSELSLAAVRRYFQAHPDELSQYTARNPRYIFFTRTQGGPFGSLGRPVTTDVSIATDKKIFPPGAATVSALNGGPAHLRLDQDTGGGIRAAGRCDLYRGVGEEAEVRAGSQFAEGRLYYLIARD
jgi:membrane-bound lytic murein transglycosylase A